MQLRVVSVAVSTESKSLMAHSQQQAAALNEGRHMLGHSNELNSDLDPDSCDYDPEDELRRELYGPMKKKRRSRKKKSGKPSCECDRYVINENAATPMCAHVAVRLQKCIVFFGGATGNGCDISLSVIHVYNLDSERWKRYKISDGERRPPNTRYACGTSLSRNKVIMFGGETLGLFTNALWELSRMEPNKFKWQKISIGNEADQPSPRCRATAWEYEGKLWTFAGSGRYPRGYLNVSGKWIATKYDHKENVWLTNQINCYNTHLSKWENVVSSGAVPSPRCDTAATRIGHIVWVYGGDRNFANSSLSDLYSLNLENMMWTQHNIPIGVPQPISSKFPQFNSNYRPTYCIAWRLQSDKPAGM